MDMYLPSTPTIAANLHASQTMVQLTLSGCLAGLAIGQLIAGPLSDGLGRRKPLFAGLIGFIALSIACAFAPSIDLLIAFRFLQGMAGAAGVVLSLAMVRDLYDGPELARALGSLTLVFGLAPVLAPVIGGQILRFTSWRGVFGVLAGVGLVLLLVSCFLPETLPAHLRTPPRFRQLLADSRTLFRDPRYSGNALAVGFGSGALITYVSSLPFIVEDAYRLSPQLFSAFFTINAIGLTAMAQLGTRLVRRVPAARLARGALCVQVLGGLAFCAAALLRHPPLAALLVPLFVFVAGFGMMRPNATALAISGQSAIAGTAAAYLGALQFMVGAVLAPFAGLGSPGATAPAGFIIGGLCVAAFAATMLIARRGARGGARAPGQPPVAAAEFGARERSAAPAVEPWGGYVQDPRPTSWSGYDPGEPPPSWLIPPAAWLSSTGPWTVYSPSPEPREPERDAFPSWRVSAPGEPPVPRRW
jgi:DHA1 family bicyclomycin/chloramphenicol resistance-like MFS transporter